MTKTRIKYLKDSKGAPIACLAYKMIDFMGSPIVTFGISISNPERYDVTFEKNITKWNAETKSVDPTGEVKKVLRKGVQDHFVKKEARRLATERLEKAPNLVKAIANPSNPVLDILRFLEETHEVRLGQENKTIISSRVRSAARRTRKSMIAAHQEKEDSLTSVYKYAFRRTSRKLQAALIDVMQILGVTRSASQG